LIDKQGRIEWFVQGRHVWPYARKDQAVRWLAKGGGGQRGSVSPPMFAQAHSQRPFGKPDVMATMAIGRLEVKQVDDSWLPSVTDCSLACPDA